MPLSPKTSKRRTIALYFLIITPRNPMPAKSIINFIDHVTANMHVNVFGEKPALSTFLFHACLEQSTDYRHHLLYPQERLTVSDFRNFIDYFQNKGYQFISPEQVDQGQLNPKQKYGLITFDDGYFNNFNLLPVLEEFKVPALFFVPTAYFNNGKLFWSDALYHYRKKGGQTDAMIQKEVIHLKSLKLKEIEHYILEQCGAKALDAANDMNRFMTEQEFIRFAQHPFVHIGNHTHTHEILTNLDTEAVRQEFEVAQNILQQLLGYRPGWVSYPNGSFNDAVISVAAQSGMHTGITTIMEKNYFPLDNRIHGQLLLHRFNPVVVNGQMHLNKFRSDFQLKTQLKKWLS